MTSRITQDVVGMVPLLGAVLESATGLKLRDLMTGQNGTTAEVNGHIVTRSENVSESQAGSPSTAEVVIPAAALPQPSGDGALAAAGALP